MEEYRVNFTKRALQILDRRSWVILSQDLSDNGLCDVADILMYLNNDIKAGINFPGSEYLLDVLDLVEVELELRQRAILLILVPPETNRIEA